MAASEFPGKLRRLKPVGRLAKWEEPCIFTSVTAGLARGSWRLIIVFAMMSSWFIATNHCGLAAQFDAPHHGPSAAADAHGCCDKSSAPVDEKPTVCCDELSKGAVKPALHGSVESCFAGEMSFSTATAHAPNASNHPQRLPALRAPPDQSSAQSLLLTRCQPAHAPPVG